MYDLTPTELETNLTAFTCSHCNGNWIRDVDYKMWRTAHGEDLPEKNRRNNINSNRFVLSFIRTAHDWESDDFHLSKDVFESAKISLKQKEAMRQQLIAAVKNSSVSRKCDLAKIIIDSGGARHAIPLLQNCLKHLGDKDDDDAGVYRSDVKERLFEAYCESGDWRTAEKMFYANKDEWWWEYLYLKLEKLSQPQKRAMSKMPFDCGVLEPI
jgi:hypothetical protein